MSPSKVSDDHSQLARGERRGHLRRLDDILEVLEQLNLAEEKVIPPHVALVLRAHGVDPDSGPIPLLIERVWEAQRPYLLHLPDERRSRIRRSPQVYDIGAAIQAVLARLGTPE